jgi:hypothetical protein
LAEEPEPLWLAALLFRVPEAFGRYIERERERERALLGTTVHNGGLHWHTPFVTVTFVAPLGGHGWSRLIKIQTDRRENNNFESSGFSREL